MVIEPAKLDSVGCIEIFSRVLRLAGACGMDVDTKRALASDCQRAFLESEARFILGRSAGINASGDYGELPPTAIDDERTAYVLGWQLGVMDRVEHLGRIAGRERLGPEASPFGEGEGLGMLWEAGRKAGLRCVPILGGANVHGWKRPC